MPPPEQRSSLTSHIKAFNGISSCLYGFTLAEVLITLGVIGIVASMTMPNLIQKHKEKETVAKLKKINSILSQALISAIDESGTTVDQWNLEGGDSKNGSQILADNYFKPYFKIADNCSIIKSCIGHDRYIYLNGTPHISYANQGSYKHLLLADGTLIIFHVSPNFKTCSQNNNCAEIFVDTNGYYKGPNQFGKDFFVFSVKKDKIIPYGTQRELTNFATNCNRTKGSGYGLSCGAWILAYENMDYLHCDDLQWGKKIKCK